MHNLFQIDQVILLLMLTIFIAVGLSWISIKLAPGVGLMDIPGSADHKDHARPMPLTGGVIMMDSLILMVLITGMWRVSDIWAIFISGLVVGLFGLWDDFKHLTVSQKLMGQILGAVILIVLGVQVDLFNSPEFFFRTGTNLDNWFNIGLTILWVVTLTNAFNFIDSSDGLVVGLSGVSSAFFLIISQSLLWLVPAQTELIFLCTVILGTCIALYFFNSHPASLFLGDSGAQMLGFLLASVAILYNPPVGNQSSTWFVPILIFSLPLFDMLLVVFSRIRRKRKIHEAAQDHTYHRLAQRGVPIQHAVLIMHGTSLILSMIGFLCLTLPVLWANLVFGLVVLLGVSAYFELDRNYQ
tara:strand:+ start:59 stop:1123 length:1065 start_codon:yes stop_codon:yes gene_type:complete